MEFVLQKLVTHLISSHSRAACTGTQLLTKQVTCINLPNQDTKQSVSVVKQTQAEQRMAPSRDQSSTRDYAIQV